MNPAWSVIFFTTLIGAAQGLAVTLAFATLARGAAPASAGFALLVAAGIGALALAASFLHLGRPERAWRAVAMWRTSWLSREVIVAPAFVAAVVGWALALHADAASAAATVVLPLLAIALAALLWWCTAMIYACLRFVQEWAHPLTVVNYSLLGLASGLVLAGTSAAALGDSALASALAVPSLIATLLAAASRAASLRRNARLKPLSTLQSATGIHASRLVQVSMGMSAGAFNTREFFHGVRAAMVRRIKLGFIGLAFVMPALGLIVMQAAGASASPPWWAAVLAVQYAGLLGERWFFFAQARHPQNLYYQVVS